MNYERQKRLIEKLLEKSRAGELDWTESAKPNSFQVSFSKHSVLIYQINTGFFGSYKIEIKDSYGNTAESFDNDDLTKSGEHPSSNWHNIMAEIFAISRRKALGADEALESILSEMS